MENLLIMTSVSIISTITAILTRRNFVNVKEMFCVSYIISEESKVYLACYITIV